jgi:hypothetical protein
LVDVPLDGDEDPDLINAGKKIESRPPAPQSGPAPFRKVAALMV